jgi:hypothetical protein
VFFYIDALQPECLFGIGILFVWAREIGCCLMEGLEETVPLQWKGGFYFLMYWELAEPRNIPV